MRFLCFSALCLGLLLSVATLDAQSAQPAKDAVPAAPALSAAAALANDVYKGDVAAAKTPEQKMALVRKFLDGARDEKGAGRFVLLVKARDLALDAGDVEGCEAALDGLEASFAVDAVKVRTDAYLALARNVHIYADQQKLAEDISAAVQAALSADRFDVAKVAAEAGMGNALRVNDAEVTQLAGADLRMVREIEAAYAEVKKAAAVLAATPGDPDANLKTGKYHCFIKGDWKSGLPMLALGSDAALKALAERENAAAAVDEQMKQGDAWWDIGEKLTGTAKITVQAHAATWYLQALPTLGGLQKTRLEQRIAKSKADMEGSHVAAGAGWVDLLKLVDVNRDAVKGHWELRNGKLVSDDADMGRVEFLYQPPAEYDFRVVFSRTAGNDCMAQICGPVDHQFGLIIGGWENSVFGFELVGGKRANGNATTQRSKDMVANGRRYTSVIKVRKDRVQSYVDGKLILEWKTDYSDMSLPDYLQLHRTDTLGLASCRSPMIFEAVGVREVTGKGTLLNAPAENK